MTQFNRALTIIRNTKFPQGSATSNHNYNAFPFLLSLGGSGSSLHIYLSSIFGGNGTDGSDAEKLSKFQTFA